MADNEKVYITVKGYGEARFEEKKSVFIISFETG